MKKAVIIALIVLLITAAVAAVVFLKLSGGLPAAVTEPAYDEELYRQFREAEAAGNYTAMNAAYDENMKKTGVSFLEGGYDQTHGGQLYTYSYSVSVKSKVKGDDKKENAVSGKLYIVTESLDREAQTAGDDDYFAVDRRTAKDPEFIVMDSYRADSEEVIRALCQLLLDHEAAHPTDWDRTLESMVPEWQMHNLSYLMGYKVDHSQHVNLNNADENTDWLKRAVNELK